jgi:subtilase family serine protease
MKSLAILLSILFCVCVLTAYSQIPQRIQPQVKIQRLPPKDGPDLVITNVTGVPDAITSLDPNGECPVFFPVITVQNIGNQDAWFPSNTWIVGGESQDVRWDPTTSSSVKNCKTTAGKAKCLRTNPVTISFMVDPQNRVAEAYETNNVWTKSVSNTAVPNLDQKPDLIIQNVSFMPEKPDYYSRVMISLEIKNIGAGSAVFCSSDWTWKEQIEGQNYAAGGAGPTVILPGEVKRGGIYISESGELANGCYRVFVQADPNNAVAESNENNNSRTAYLSIGGASCELKIKQDSMVKAVVNLQSVSVQKKSTSPMVRVP